MPGKMLIQIEGSATEELKMFIAGLDYTNFKDCVRCFLCDAKCKTAHGLWTHLKKHGAQQDIINPLNAIRCALRKQIVDEDEEFTYIVPGKDVENVLCKCGKDVEKKGLRYHLTKAKQHVKDQVPIQKILSFRAYKDGRNQEKKGANKENFNSFEIAYKNFKDKCIALMPQPSQGSDAAHNNIPSQGPDAAHNQIAELAAIVKQVVNPIADCRLLSTQGLHVIQNPNTQPKDIEFIDVAIHPNALAYKKPSQDELDANTNRRRFTWPKTLKCNINIDPIVKFVRKRCKVVKADGTFKKKMQGIKYFLSLFEFTDLSVSIEDCFKAIVKNGLLSDVFNLDICDPNIYWSRTIKNGLVTLSSYLTLRFCERGDQICKNLLDQVKAGFLEEMRPQFADAKKEQNKRRKKIDILRNKRLPPIPVRFAGVKKAINDIDVLFKENISEFENTGHLRTGIRTCLNSAMYGANAELSYPGRAGEMLDLNPDAIKDVLADEKMVVCG